MHIAIKGRRLECEWLQLGVAGDGGVEQYHFQVPRYTGSGLDLSQAMAYILFERPDGTQGMTPILEPDKEIGSTTVTLRWLVGREITEQPGRLRIAIKFSGLEGETWHSEAADCVVAATIEASSPQPVSLFSAKTAARTAVPDNEPPITVSERTLNIPAGLQNIAVQNDQNSETVTMICPRYFDGHDLSSYSFFLRTQNSEGGYDPVALPVTVQGGELHMEWTLRPPQTSYSGRLQIQLWVTGEDFDWQTAEASVNIVRQIGGEPVIPVSPPVMDEFLKQISVVAEKAKTSETAAAASASAAGASETSAASSAAEAAASKESAAGSAAAAQNAAAAAAASASDAAASAALAEQHAVPVSNAEINEAGHLVVTLSNGNRIDAGEARGPQGPEGVEGPAGQSPYEAAVAGGYTGTEAAFQQELAALPSLYGRFDSTGAAKNAAALGGIPAATVTSYSYPTVYVSETGNDTTGTGSSAKPWRTVQKAVNAVRPYHGRIAISVAAGNYPERVTVQYVNCTLYITGKSTGHAVLRGITAINCQNLVFQYLDFTETQEDETAALAAVTNCKSVQIKDGTLTGNQKQRGLRVETSRVYASRLQINSCTEACHAVYQSDLRGVDLTGTGNSTAIYSGLSTVSLIRSSISAQTPVVTASNGTVTIDGTAYNTPATSLGGHETEYFLRKPNRNLLNNWYFPDPVNQRGEEAFAAVRGYCIDQWYIYGGTISQTTNGISLQKNSGYVELHQKLEALDTSLTYTLSAIVNDELRTVTGIIGDIYNALAARGWDGEPTNRIEAYISTTLKNVVMVRFVFVNSNAYVVKAAKLELGDHQTLAHQDSSGKWILNDPPPNKALELLKCQRYQLVLPSIIDSFGAVGVGSSWNATSIQIDIPLPSTFCRSATVSLSGNWALRGAGSLINFNSSNAAVSGTTMPHVFNLDITGLANIVPNECYEMLMADKTAKLIIDANI